jgi:hypothetical protein
MTTIGATESLAARVSLSSSLRFSDRFVSGIWHGSAAYSERERESEKEREKNTLCACVCVCVCVCVCARARARVCVQGRWPAARNDQRSTKNKSAMRGYLAGT